MLLLICIVFSSLRPQRFCASARDLFLQPPVNIPGTTETLFPNVVPGIGVGIDMGAFDILANIEFSLFNISIDDWSLRSLLFGIYAGIAPKAAVSDKLTLSFPIFAKFLRGSVKLDDGDDDYTYGKNAIGLDAGARVYYALNDTWSIYAGVQVSVLEYWLEGKMKGGGSSVKDDTNVFRFLNNGTLDFGVRYSF